MLSGSDTRKQVYLETIETEVEWPLELYSYIPLIGSLILGFLYATTTEASSRSKLIVSVIVAVSVAIWWWYPQWLLPATLLQAGVSIYVLMYLKVNKLDV